MQPFDLSRPASLQEALSLLDPQDADVRPMGGGTAIILMMKAGMLRPRRLVSLRSVEPRYQTIMVEPDGSVRIGGMATLSTIEHSAEVALIAPVVPRAMKRLSNVRVRNVATIGGNLAHGDPHMDLPAVLSALGAKVVLQSPAGRREIALDTLITGYYETALQTDELIVEVVIPARPGWRSAYAKITTRSADDWPALGVAVSIKAEAGAISDCRLFVGAATDRPTRLAEAEALLLGAAADDATLRRASDAAVEETVFLGDAQGSASYKKELLRVHLGRAIRSALFDGQASTGGAP